MRATARVFLSMLALALGACSPNLADIRQEASTRAERDVSAMQQPNQDAHREARVAESRHSVHEVNETIDAACSSSMAFDTFLRALSVSDRYTYDVLLDLMVQRCTDVNSAEERARERSVFGNLERMCTRPKLSRDLWYLCGVAEFERVKSQRPSRDEPASVPPMDSEVEEGL